MLDLGLSSDQLADPARGFSFAADGPLDMRIDPSRSQPASALLARMSEREIADALLELAARCQQLTEIAAKFRIGCSDFDTAPHERLCLVEPPQAALGDTQHLHGRCVRRIGREDAAADARGRCELAALQ